jgi:hypothetical protein
MVAKTNLRWGTAHFTVVGSRKDFEGRIRARLREFDPLETRPEPPALRLETNRRNEKKRNVVITVQVISDRADEYFGKKGLVKQQVITCQDMDQSGYRLLQNFDYTLSEPEKEKFAGKLQDKIIQIGVRELTPFGGRFRARGSILAQPVA